MGRRSTVAALPAELVQACNGLIREGRTIAEILQALQALGANVSRSAVGRYVKGARDAMEKYRQAQEVAKVWVDKLEAEPGGDVARLLPEMLRVVAWQSLSELGEAQQPVKAMALKDLAGANKTHVDVELQLRRLREQVRSRADAAAREVESMTRQAGMSDELVASIRQRILGVGDKA